MSASPVSARQRRLKADAGRSLRVKGVQGPMTSYTLTDLELADAHIAQGEQHIARQEEIVANLAALDADVVEARKLLSLFRELQQQHEAHRKAIAEALGQLG